MVTSGVAERVLRLRARMHLSQAELAARVGVDQATISRWEAGERAPRNAARVRLEGLMEKSDGQE